jgi:hypothetical protein
VGEVLRGAWHAMLANEGVAPITCAAPDACPACGTAADLVNGACSDCGLQLE